MNKFNIEITCTTLLQAVGIVQTLHTHRNLNKVSFSFDDEARTASIQIETDESKEKIADLVLTNPFNFIQAQPESEFYLTE